MRVLTYARQRVSSFLQEIEKLKDSDFPHAHSREALEQIAVRFNARLTALCGLSSGNTLDVIRASCSEVLIQIFIFHPVLGFILRSTNVRNSFEVYRPILNLSRKILGNDTKLILSSEWQFSPFVYSALPDLPNFVLIGLPAFESGNPLLTPLAGHELGHTTWQKKNLDSKYSPLLLEAIYKNIEDRWTEFEQVFDCPKAAIRTNLFVPMKISRYHQCACRQAQETFCDFLGIRIFSESYLHAFAYLVAPGDSMVRPDIYPKTIARVTNMITASHQYNVPVPDGYSENYSDQLDPPNATHRLMMSLADHALTTIVGTLVTEADSIVRAAQIPEREPKSIELCLRSYKMLVPSSGASSLASILNAGWTAFNDETLWSNSESLKKNRNQVLFDIILKSIEVYEFEQITGHLI